MALGGVATGSIKAQLAAIATAAVTNKGSKLDCRARAVSYTHLTLPTKA